MSKDDINKHYFSLQKSASHSYSLMPWIDDPKYFFGRCSQCQNCIKSCPEQIIINSDSGFPMIDFSLGECTFCGECAEHCEQNIFNHIETIPWKKKAVINDNCLLNEGDSCQICSDYCLETAFVFLVSGKDKPHVELDKCNGCGACFSPCPVNAISIQTIE